MKVGVFEWRRKKGDVKRYVKELKHTWQQKLRGSQRRATSESGERESRDRVFCFDVEEGKFEVVAIVSTAG